MSKYPNRVVPEWAMEEAAAAIQWVKAKYPTLGRGGWEIGLGWDSEESVATAIAFLDFSGVQVRERLNRECTSYSWKHRAEEWGGAIGFAPYVANGDMILAALWRGVKTRRANDVDWKGPNSYCALHLPENLLWYRRARRRAPEPTRASVSDDRVEEVS